MGRAKISWCAVLPFVVLTVWLLGSDTDAEDAFSKGTDDMPTGEDVTGAVAKNATVVPFPSATFQYSHGRAWCLPGTQHTHAAHTDEETQHTHAAHTDEETQHTHAAHTDEETQHTHAAHTDEETRQRVNKERKEERKEAKGLPDPAVVHALTNVKGALARRCVHPTLSPCKAMCAPLPIASHQPLASIARLRAHVSAYGYFSATLSRR